MKPTTSADNSDFNAISKLAETGLTPEQIANAIKKSKELSKSSTEINDALTKLDSVTKSTLDLVTSSESIYYDAPTTMEKYGKNRKITINDFSGSTFSEKIKNSAIWASEIKNTGKTLYIPKGYYVLDASISVLFGHHGITICGDGQYETIINIVFTADNQSALTFSKGTVPLYNMNIENISFLSTLNTFNNTIVMNLLDIGNVYFDRVRILNVGSTGINNKALNISGREQYTFMKCYIKADAPIKLNKNPNTTNGFVSIDHFHFIDGFYSTGTGNSFFEVEDGAELTGFKISGQPAFIGGKHIFKYITTTTYQNSAMLIHDGGRWEQHDSEYDAAAYKIVTPHYSEFKNISISNFYNSHGSVVSAYGIMNVSIENCVNVGTTPFAILEEVRNFSHKNVLTSNIKAILTNMREIFAILDTDSYNVPIVGYYTKDFGTTSKYNRPIRINGTELMGLQKSLLSGTAHYLNIRTDQLSKFAKLDITIVSEDGSIADNGVFLLTKSTTLGVLGVIKISGSDIFSNANTNGKICIYNSGVNPLDGPSIFNRTSVTLNIHCILNTATELSYI